MTFESITERMHSLLELQPVFLRCGGGGARLTSSGLHMVRLDLSMVAN